MSYSDFDTTGYVRPPALIRWDEDLSKLYAIAWSGLQKDWLGYTGKDLEYTAEWRRIVHRS